MTTTTDTALRAGSGDFGFVLLIEGYEYLITSAADLTAVRVAYADTDWTQALGGLVVIGGIKQSIEPFKEDLDKPELTFQIMDFDGEDTFGRAVWCSKPTFSSRLNAVFEPNANGSGTITVDDNTAADSAGVLYLGTKRVEYTSKSGSTGFTVPAGGASTFLPFTADTGNTYAWPNNLAPGADGDVGVAPRVADVPQAWHGRRVALYIHRIRDGVWDTRDQAHLEFAGTIFDISDGEPGMTTLRCRDLRATIESAVLHRRQWTGVVAPGIYLTAGDTLRVSEIQHSYGAVPAGDTVASNPLTVVASGASGTDEIDEGLYDFDDFIIRLNRWLIADPNLNGEWTASKPLLEDGWRTVLTASFSTLPKFSIALISNRGHLLEFMGFTDIIDWSATAAFAGGADVLQYFSVTSPVVDPGAKCALVSEEPPFKSKVMRNPGKFTDFIIDIDAESGTWYDDTTFAPDFLQEIADGPKLSYVLIGDKQLAVANYDSSTQLTKVTAVPGFGREYEDGVDFAPPGITYDDPEGTLTVRQVVLLTGQFSELMPRLFASIDGRGVNHDTYDDLPWGAAVPWSLLGDPFVNSCRSLEQAVQSHTLTVLLTKPTTLGAILQSEMALRFAFLVWKDGGYRFVSPPAPNSITADHTLTEANKAIAGDGPIPPSRSDWSSDMMVNVIKVNRNRDVTGKFRGAPLTVTNRAVIDVHGDAQVVTIDAINSIDDAQGISSATTEHLAMALVSRVLPMFDKPIKVVTRTIAPTLFHAAPGDTATLSDDLVRDPASGERGVSGRACIVLSSFHDYGHEGGTMAGEVTLLLSDEDRTYPLGAAAVVDTTYTSGLYTNGYDSTNLRLKLKLNSYTRAATDEDDVTFFAASDAVRVIELDPADPTSHDAWSRTIASVDTATSYIQLTAAISSPSWSGATKKFAVIPQAYASCQASQKLRAFQADRTDGMVQDVAEPNLYGTSNCEVFGAGNSTDLPSLLPTELYGDGKPFTPHQLQALARMHNNLIHRKTALHLPFMPAAAGSTTSLLYEAMYFFPLDLGTFQMAGQLRYLSIAPMLSTNSGLVTGSIRVTSSGVAPIGTGLIAVTWPSPTRSIEFTRSSTTPAVATAQDLLPVLGPGGVTWITIEGKVSIAGTAYLHSLADFYLKAGA
jgi:hypothetical protein